MDDIIADCERIRSDIQGLNDTSHGPLDNKYSQKSTRLPFVLLLGNHSSGKSSFANYLMGRTIQSTGVAPTDDGFTVICPHNEDLDRTGSALASDPELGFQSLSYFGPTLINLTKLKYRKDLRSKEFMIIDTPGMIDSPAWNGSSVGGVDVSRGYDFSAAVQWFAERADLILLFFDPDKPGTTGETLNILTSSLAGFDYKLRIILNKADQFLKINDFARCYGSLCWNLAKVIHRKDLPPIHTMCVYPTPSTSKGKSSTSASASPGSAAADAAAAHGHPLAAAIHDLLATRDAIVDEVHTTPKMRVDNEVSRLHSSLEMLLMHMKVVREVSEQYIGYWWAWSVGVAVGAAVQVGVAAAAVHQVSTVRPEYKYHALGLSGLACGSSLALTVYLRNQFCRTHAAMLTTRHAYKTVFRGLYGVSSCTDGMGGLDGEVRVIGESSADRQVDSAAATVSPARALHHYTSASPYSSKYPNSSMMALWHSAVLPHLLHTPMDQILYVNTHSNPKEKGLSAYFISNLVSDRDTRHLETLLEHNMSRLRRKAGKLLVNKPEAAAVMERCEDNIDGNIVVASCSDPESEHHHHHHHRSHSSSMTDSVASETALDVSLVTESEEL